MSYSIDYMSSNKKDKIYARIWDCEKPKFILQIAHGMSEHIDRYDDFAKYLNSKNIIVAGNNHLGHGASARKLGYFGEGDVLEYIISDMHHLSDYLKDKYNLPIYYLGHSMGSFILRYFLTKYDTEKAVIMGTGYVSNFDIQLLKNLSRLFSKLLGEEQRSKLIFLRTIGIYQLKTPPNHSWISNNKENIENWKHDELCQSPFTNNAYYYLACLLEKIKDKDLIKNTNKDTQILFVSGALDSVGDKTKGVKKVYKLYQELGYKNLSIKFFENMRHEILNETDNIKVYEYIYKFLKEPK